MTRPLAARVRRRLSPSPRCTSATPPDPHHHPLGLFRCACVHTERLHSNKRIRTAARLRPALLCETRASRVHRPISDLAFQPNTPRNTKRLPPYLHHPDYPPSSLLPQVGCSRAPAARIDVGGRDGGVSRVTISINYTSRQSLRIRLSLHCLYRVRVATGCGSGPADGVCCLPAPLPHACFVHR